MRWYLPLAFAALEVASGSFAAAAQTTDVPPSVRTRDTARGEVRLGPDRSRAMTYETRTVGVTGGQKLDDLGIAREGTAIVQLRGGELATIIRGERVKRREGEVWQVPKGEPMGVATGDDTAVLEVMIIGP
jgi:hypothetical protein